MKIFVLGTRGFPNVQGGVEKHCEELYPRLAAQGFDVTIATRKPYFTNDQRLNTWKSVKFMHIWCPRRKGLEAAVHSVLALVVAFFNRAQIVHFHTIGPALLIPIARALGLKTVLTHHGADYRRQKWGPIAKQILVFGEYLGVNSAHTTIAITETIRHDLKEKFPDRSICLIGNGTGEPLRVSSGAMHEKYALHSRGYVFAACRLVPEKGLHDLIAAYAGITKHTFQLVIAGDADHDSQYSRSLKSRARTARVILTGNVFGRDLAELYTNAGLFVLPSYHEGSPIALLEALSYDLPVLVSDIPPHREFQLSANRYFAPGDIDHLRTGMLELLAAGVGSTEHDSYRKMLAENHNWNTITNATAAVYRRIWDRK